MRFQKPNLDFDPSVCDAVITDRDREFAEKYTAIAPVACEDEPDGHTSWLMIGGRQFRLDWNGENKAEASYRCLMLARGIQELLATEATNKEPAQ